MTTATVAARLLFHTGRLLAPAAVTSTSSLPTSPPRLPRRFWHREADISVAMRSIPKFARVVDLGSEPLGCQARHKGGPYAQVRVAGVECVAEAEFESRGSPGLVVGRVADTDENEMVANLCDDGAGDDGGRTTHEGNEALIIAIGDCAGTAVCDVPLTRLRVVWPLLRTGEQLQVLGLAAADGLRPLFVSRAQCGVVDCRARVPCDDGAALTVREAFLAPGEGHFSRLALLDMPRPVLEKMQTEVVMNFSDERLVAEALLRGQRYVRGPDVM